MLCAVIKLDDIPENTKTGLPRVKTGEQEVALDDKKRETGRMARLRRIASEMPYAGFYCRQHPNSALPSQKRADGVWGP